MPLLVHEQQPRSRCVSSKRATIFPDCVKGTIMRFKVHYFAVSNLISFLKMPPQWPFTICWQQKQHTGRLPYLSWTFLHVTEDRRTKISFILKLTKDQVTSCTKANNHYNFKSWVPGLCALNSALKDLCLHDSRGQFYENGVDWRKAYTYTIVLDVSVMNKQQKNTVHLS